MAWYIVFGSPAAIYLVLEIISKLTSRGNKNSESNKSNQAS